MKFSGKIGFWGEEKEVSPGIWRPEIVEKKYVGEVLRNNRKLQDSNNKQNPNLTINNQISILSDLYARQNWNAIRYVEWNGVKWEVSSIEINYPRLILEIGGVYNAIGSETGESTEITHSSL